MELKFNDKSYREDTPKDSSNVKGMDEVSSLRELQSHYVRIYIRLRNMNPYTFTMSFGVLARGTMSSTRVSLFYDSQNPEVTYMIENDWNT